MFPMYMGVFLYMKRQIKANKGVPHVYGGVSVNEKRD